MDFSYTPRLEELKARAAALTQRLMAYEDECERDGSLTPARLAEIRDAVLESGLNAINMPAEWGGAGLTVLEQVVVQEELGKLTNALWDCVWRPANPLRHCTPEQRERWLAPGIRGERRDAVAITEAEAGSDPSGIATTATRDGDGWRIDGVKWFVTVGDVADHLLVLAMADGGPTMFIVDKDLPGVVVRRVPALHAHVRLRAPGVRLRGRPRRARGAARRGRRRLRADARLVHRGAADDRRADDRRRRAGAGARRRSGRAERRQGGVRLLDRQLIQGMLADSATEIAANRALTHQVAAEFDRGGDRKTLHAKAAMVKLSASEASNRVVDRCVQIFGGRGYMREQPVERLWRELRVDRIWEGTSEIQRLVIANEIDKRGLDGLLAFPPAEAAVPA